MSALLMIRDETASGTLLRSFALTLPTSYTTIRDVIAARVRHEVDTYNAARDGATFRGLVQPRGSEQLANGFELEQHRTIDADEQVARALEAFECNGFIVLVGQHQAESLDEGFLVQADTEVSFVKLVPLVGG